MQIMTDLVPDDAIDVVNLMAQMKTIDEFEDPNEVKVVVDKDEFALYFSREPIPTRSKAADIPMKKQVCIIPFTRNFLLEYTEMEPTPLEIAESVDMMRVLENGLKVKMVSTKNHTYPVDTENDLKRVEKILSAG